MKRTTGLTAGFLALTLTAGTLLTPIAASASEEGKRNTAIGLGALAATLLLTQKNKLPGIVAAGGAAYAFSQLGSHYRRGGDDWRIDRDRHDYDRNKDRHDSDRRDNNGGYRYGENNR